MLSKKILICIVYRILQKFCLDFEKYVLLVVHFDNMLLSLSDAPQYQTLIPCYSLYSLLFPFPLIPLFPFPSMEGILAGAWQSNKVATSFLIFIVNFPVFFCLLCFYEVFSCIGFLFPSCFSLSWGQLLSRQKTCNYY